VTLTGGADVDKAEAESILVSQIPRQNES